MIKTLAIFGAVGFLIPFGVAYFFMTLCSWGYLPFEYCGDMTSMVLAVVIMRIGLGIGIVVSLIYFFLKIKVKTKED